MFINYNRSCQHDDDKDEWGSDTELRCWLRAAKWNPSNAGSIIQFTSVMIYSIAVLDTCDFEAIGWKMPKGTGVDATVNNGAVAPKHTKRKHSIVKGSDDATESLVRAFESSDVKEDARKVLLEFGSSKEKIRARKELNRLAFGNAILSDSEDADGVVTISGEDSVSEVEV
jgi:hypothetical protein